jgi:hypothetical protein
MHWIDQAIREARERGEFDDLPGAGKPIADLDTPRDDLWWVKQLMRREELSFTPPTLAVRKAVDDARAAIDRQTSEAAVRRIVAELNAQIIKVNRTATSGPPSSMMPFDADEVVEKWRARRCSPTA